MPQIQWPQTGILKSTTISLSVPGRVIVRAEFSEREHVLDPREPLWAGSAVVMEDHRTSALAREMEAVLALVTADPDSWVLLPWGRASVYSVNSPALDADNAVKGAAVVQATPQSMRLDCPEAGGLQPVIGEVFGLRSRTAIITSVTQVAGTSGAGRQYDVGFRPRIPAAAAGDEVRGRHFLPCRPSLRNLPEDAVDATQGGPWTFSVIEEFVP